MIGKLNESRRHKATEPVKWQPAVIIVCAVLLAVLFYFSDNGR